MDKEKWKKRQRQPIIDKEIKKTQAINIQVFLDGLKGILDDGVFAS